MIIYLCLHFVDQEQQAKPLLALSWFFAYMKLISFLRFFRETGQLVFTILYVAHKSLNFVFILIICIIAISLSGLALSEQDDYFSGLESAYVMTFGEFEDAYKSNYGFIAFILSTYTVPLLLLNLLISIMQDAHA